MVQIRMEKDEKRVCEKARITIEFDGEYYFIHADNGLFVVGDGVTYDLDKKVNIATIRVYLRGIQIGFINYKV